MIATFFRDYLRAAARARTIHVVAPPTFLTRGVGACKNRNNAEPFRILVLRQRLSIRLYALRRRDTYGSLLTFVIRLLLKNVAGTRTVTYVRDSARYPPARASAPCAAQHVATPTMCILNFRDQKSNHENIVPRKFGAIRYTSASRIQCNNYSKSKPACSSFQELIAVEYGLQISYSQIQATFKGSYN